MGQAIKMSNEDNIHTRQTTENAAKSKVEKNRTDHWSKFTNKGSKTCTSSKWVIWATP